MFKNILVSKQKAVKVKVCPFSTHEGPYEAFTIASNRPGVEPVEIPRICLEFLEVSDFPRMKGKPVSPRTVWFNIFESKQIREHEHTRTYVPGS